MFWKILFSQIILLLINELMLATLDMFYYMLNYVSDISILPYRSKHGKLLLSLELQFIH